jgi:hypothetical protein
MTPCTFFGIYRGHLPSRLASYVAALTVSCELRTNWIRWQSPTSKYRRAALLALGGVPLSISSTLAEFAEPVGRVAPPGHDVDLAGARHVKRNLSFCVKYLSSFFGSPRDRSLRMTNSGKLHILGRPFVALHLSVMFWH